MWWGSVTSLKILFPGSRVSGSSVSRSQDPGPWVPVSGSQGSKSQSSRVPGSRVSDLGSWISDSSVLGPWSQGHRSQLLIVDYALLLTSLLLFFYFIFLKSDIMNFRRFPLATIFFFFL